MWVSGRGWKEEVMATPSEKSRSGMYLSPIAPRMDSELVRVSVPSAFDIRGRVPASLA